jgi:Tfp pilus assembly protein PilV
MTKLFIQPPAARRQQQGIALIEALVSLLIISLGFLG